MAKGLSVEDVTNEVEWSTSKLIRIETGRVVVSAADLTLSSRSTALATTSANTCEALPWVGSRASGRPIA
jgi:hypothetical protein